MKKIKDKKQLTIWIPRVLHDQFDKICTENYQTMSEALRAFIIKYIKQYIKENSKEKI